MKIRHYAYIMIITSIISGFLLVTFFILSEHMNQKYLSAHGEMRSITMEIKYLDTITGALQESYNREISLEWMEKAVELQGVLEEEELSARRSAGSLKSVVDQMETLRESFRKYYETIPSLCGFQGRMKCVPTREKRAYLITIQDNLKELSEKVDSIFAEELKEINNYRTGFSYIQAGLLFVLILELFISAFFLLLQVIRPLKELTRDFKIISDGNLDYRTSVDYDNEFGDMMISFNSMIASIKEVTASKDELKREIESRQVMMKENKFQSERFYTILNNIPGVLYVVDPVNWEILFANQQLKDLLGKDPVGDICFKEFQGNEMPCQNCMNKNMSFNVEPISFVFHNNKLKLDFYMTDQVIRWPDGRGVLLKIGMDITRQVQYEKTISRNQERLEALLGLYSICGDDNEIMDYTLESAVRLTESEAGYLHFIHPNQKEIELFTWSREVSEKCSANQRSHYPLKDAGIWADSIRTGEAVICNNYPQHEGRKGLPEGHFPIIRHMSVPVYDGDTIVAVAGVANKKGEYTQDDVNQLTLFMQGMWGVLQRNKKG